MNSTVAITTQIRATTALPTNAPIVNRVLTVSSESASLSLQRHVPEQRAWLQASESALAEGWDNELDAQYDALS